MKDGAYIVGDNGKMMELGGPVDITPKVRTLHIMDFTGKWFDTGLDISEEGLKKIATISVSVWTGDHVASVVMADGTEWEFDSAVLSGNSRTEDEYGGFAMLYDSRTGRNLLDEYMAHEDVFDVEELKADEKLLEET